MKVGHLGTKGTLAWMEPAFARFLLPFFSPKLNSCQKLWQEFQSKPLNSHFLEEEMFAAPWLKIMLNSAEL